MNLEKLRGIPVYGDTAYRNGACPLEDAELVTFVNQVRINYPQIARVMLHIKNEGKRHAAQVLNERKKGGLKKGATDIILPLGSGFIMELKRADHTLSVIEPEQIEYLDTAREFGAFACVCLGWLPAMEALEKWAWGADIKLR